MPNLAPDAAEAKLQRFEQILSLEPFKGLKAILNSLSANRETLCDAVTGTTSYEDFLAKLGYRLTLTKQLHVQDCFSRMGPVGGIRAVLPYHDIPTQGSMPTILNFDSTVTTTPKSAVFFNGLFQQFKKQLAA